MPNSDDKVLQDITKKWGVDFSSPANVEATRKANANLHPMTVDQMKAIFAPIAPKEVGRQPSNRGELK